MLPAMLEHSPRPGMDPWLERRWESIHFTYVQECRRQLVGQLPDGLFAEVEETTFHGDAGVESTGQFAVDEAASRVTHLPAEPAVVTHVAIRSLRGDEPLVTAVEVFSPTNKATLDGRRQCRRKRQAYRSAGANLVEIDLVRRGRHLVDVPPDRVAAAAPPTPYRAVVRRAVRDDRPVEAEYYPIPLRDRLPVIRVPLRVGDADATLDLRPPIDAAYQLGGYGRRIDYARPPEEPLSADDASWAAERVAATRAVWSADMADGSPFPGMDPWLERSWGDVQHELISELRRQVVAQLPPDLFAVVEENVYVVGDGSERQVYFPDVGTFGGMAATSDGGGRSAGNLTLAKPLRLLLSDEPVVQGVVQIRHLAEGHPLVTAIEVLSPRNKGTRDGREAYLDKRRAYGEAGVNLLELDLLRGGRDMPGLVDVDRLDPRLPSAYRCSVRRRGPSRRVTLDLYPLPLRDRLPAVALPLRTGEPAVELDLQPPVDAVYRLGGYGRRIDYARPPEEPLSADDAAWAADRVAAWAAG